MGMESGESSTIRNFIVFSRALFVLEEVVSRKGKDGIWVGEVTDEIKLLLF